LVYGSVYVALIELTTGDTPFRVSISGTLGVSRLLPDLPRTFYSPVETVRYAREQLSDPLLEVCRHV